VPRPAGFKNTALHNQRISEALTGHKRSPEHMRNWIASRKKGAGWKHSEETKRKIGLGVKGKLIGRFVGSKSAGWKGDNASRDAGHSRALKLFKNIGPCIKCGSWKNLDRHHRDGNTLNNKKSNVQILCRKCHMEIDGRLKKNGQRYKSFGRRKDGTFKTKKGKQK
jgi:hypothetical protein